MIYLILNMLVYLLLALLLGAAAGWLLRNQAGSKREDELQKMVTEARARVPQFESLMRARDEQVQRLRDEVKSKNEKIAELSAQLHGKDEEIRTKQRELGKLSARNEALEGGPAADDAATFGGDVLDIGGELAGAGSAGSARLRSDIERLTRELEEAKAAAVDAVAEAAAAEAELARLKTETRNSEPSAGDAGEDIEELKARLRQRAEEQDRLNRALETEQRKVVELTRERELQNKSLQVLHQQLELERERGGQVSAALATGGSHVRGH